jgi:hypothetical protein
MVVVFIKNSEEDTFLFETTTQAKVDDLIRGLVEIWNMRKRVGRLVASARRLAEFGPAKPPDKQGIDDVIEAAGDATIKKGPFYKCDPLGQRTGNACDPKLIAVIEKTCRDAEQCVSKVQAKMRVALTTQMIQEKIDNVRGAVTICYPMGIPDYDPVAGALVDKDELAGMDAKAVLDPDTATLWFAGKEFFRDMIVADRIKQERSKCVMKLQGKGASAPAREPAVSEAEKKAMMAHYFKKNEEMKRIAENDEDDFFQSSWANPKGLKQSFTGMGGGGISFRPGGRRI